MSKEVSTEDELHELSPGDAEELRAFLEKRRWFEAKLKVGCQLNGRSCEQKLTLSTAQVLETLPAIYPFLHPVLLPVNPSAPANDSSLPYRHEHDKESQYHLPSAEQIQRWQSERVAFEEDILAFDGGDLGRMKEKTKGAFTAQTAPADLAAFSCDSAPSHTTFYSSCVYHPSTCHLDRPAFDYTQTPWRAARADIAPTTMGQWALAGDGGFTSARETSR